MKHFSVIGDSISTFENTMPDGYALYYDKQMQAINGMRGAADMWWAVVGETLDARLLVNGSCAGGTVVRQFPGACSRERVAPLCRDDITPDCILIYIGINDCAFGAKPRKENDEPDHTCFASAYRLMLKRLREAYPAAKLYCGTVMRSRLPDDDQWDLVNDRFRNLEDYNDEIRAAAREQGCVLIDLFASEMRYDALDGVHPTSNGHASIASAWIHCLDWRAGQENRR